MTAIELVTEDVIHNAIQAAETAGYDMFCTQRAVAKWTADHHPDLGIVDQMHRSEQMYRERQNEVIRLHRLALAQAVAAASQNGATA